MNDVDKTIDKFNKNSQEGFSSTGDVLKDLFNLLKSSSGTLNKLFPELHSPLNGLLRDVVLIKKLYDDVSKIKVEKPKVKESQKDNNYNANTNNEENGGSNLPTVIKNTTELSNASQNLVEQVINAQDASEALAEEGGNAFKLFSLKALGPIAAVVAGVVAVGVSIKGLTKLLSDLANQDIEYEKLSRQLWTTKENAREVDMALKTMGVTMKDLWLSPTLLKQFNQLRKDSKDLKLPKEYTDNLKIVQGIGLEFKRLRQFGAIAFQWIGNYILKYAKGPLNDFRNSIHSFNEWIKSNIPGMGKAVGSVIGYIIRALTVVIKVCGMILGPIFEIIKWITNLPEPFKKAFKIIAAIILAVQFPLIAVIALLDDLMTYFKGGKSLTGSIIDKFVKLLDTAKEKIKSVIDWFKNLKKEILNSDFVKGIEGLGDKIKKGFNDVKNGDFKAFISDTSAKVKDFSSPSVGKVAPSYTTSNTSHVSNSETTTNSHNTIKNDNKIYVYGTNANSTGKAVKNNLNGITLRNVQGVF
jgi:hypothetical protein